jgi:hypothetical protein
MDKIIFVDFQTKICSAWLNAVSDTVWDALGEAKTPSEARQFIGAVEEAPNDGKSYLRASLGWLEAATALTHNQLGGRDVADAHPTSAITGLDAALAGKAPTVHTHTGDQITGITGTQVSFTPGGTIAATNVQAAISELDGETQSALGGKQELLISGTTIKTINGESVLGSGNLIVTASDPTKLPLTGGTLSGDLVVQTDISTPSSQIGLSGTAANNFVLDASADNGTMKLARGNAGATTQDVMTVAANGKPSFPQLSFTPGSNADNQSSFELPNGLIIKAGNTGTVGAGGGLQVNFATSFPNMCLGVIVTSIISSGSTNVYSLCLDASLPLATSFAVRNPWTGGALGGRFIAIGY